MIAAGFTARVCALCGKSQAQGESLAAWTMLVKWATEGGIKLEAPASSYLSPKCAEKIKKQLAKK